MPLFMDAPGEKMSMAQYTLTCVCYSVIGHIKF